MSYSHAFKLDNLRNDFENIISLKREISKIKTVVAAKIEQLKNVYNDLIKSNNKKIFVFCLDSFYFQYKTFAMEMEHIDSFRTLMNNRMYCDFYKLHMLIQHYIGEHADLNIIDIETKTCPVYKDLEPFHEYKLDDIKNVHANVLELIYKLYEKCAVITDEIDHYNERHHIGFSISNFLNTLGYENKLLHDQVSLFVNYVSFFHISQRKQLTRLYSRMQEFYKDVEENININRAFSIDDIGEQNKLHRFFIMGEDISIESMLEDTEFLMENTDKVLDKVDKLLDKSNTTNITTEIIENTNGAIVDQEIASKPW